MKDAALKLAGGAATVGSRIGLAAIDWYLDFILRRREGERAVPRTRRISFTDEQRTRIIRSQGRRCMYCGVTLNRNNVEIDHNYPVDHGGSNRESNLQTLCGRCNSRKGVQTDEEFRRRYRSVLPDSLPPPSRIPQDRFAEVTGLTSQAATTRQRRREVFRTPAAKITSSSIATGLGVGIVWGAGLLQVFGDQNAFVVYTALVGFICFTPGVAVGLIWRAKHTGRMVQS